MKLYTALFIIAGLNCCMELQEDIKITPKNGIQINPQAAIFNLKVLRPSNFCNRWTSNLRNYLLYTYKFTDNSAKRKEQAEYVSKILQNVNNLFNTELNLTSRFASHPALRLFPYALAIHSLSILGLHYYDYSSWPTTLITISQNTLAYYLYSEYLRSLELHLELLNYQSKNIENYSNPQTTKTYEFNTIK